MGQDFRSFPSAGKSQNSPESLFQVAKLFLFPKRTCSLKVPQGSGIIGNSGNSEGNSMMRCRGERHTLKHNVLSTLSFYVCMI